MKAKIKTIILVLTSTLFLGCPAGHFHEYKFTGVDIADDDLRTSKIAYEDSFLKVSTGYYTQFIKPKRSGLITEIKLHSDLVSYNNLVVKDVTSTTFGKLKKVDSLVYANTAIRKKNTLIFDLQFETKNEKKVLKSVKNDTILIRLANGKNLQFVRQ